MTERSHPAKPQEGKRLNSFERLFKKKAPKFPLHSESPREVSPWVEPSRHSEATAAMVQKAQAPAQTTADFDIIHMVLISHTWQMQEFQDQGYNHSDFRMLRRPGKNVWQGHSQHEEPLRWQWEKLWKVNLKVKWRPQDTANAMNLEHLLRKSTGREQSQPERGHGGYN